jgi:hypothetical protein
MVDDSNSAHHPASSDDRWLSWDTVDQATAHAGRNRVRPGAGKKSELSCVAA